MAFGARKGFGTFETWAPALLLDPNWLLSCTSAVERELNKLKTQELYGPCAKYKAKLVIICTSVCESRSFKSTNDV